MLLLHNKDHL